MCNCDLVKDYKDVGKFEIIKMGLIGCSDFQ